MTSACVKFLVINFGDVSLGLGNEGRLDREWQAYETLSPHGLSPRPLWRCQDAIACSWLDWKRLSTQMTNPRLDPIAIQMSLFSSIRRMHDLGITHLDLNLVFEKHFEKTVSKSHFAVEKSRLQDVHVKKNANRPQRQPALGKVLEPPPARGTRS